MKHLFTLAFLLTLAFQPVHSQGANKQASSTVKINKERYDSLALHIPRYSGRINDFALLFTRAETKTLDSLVAAFEKKTTVEIAVATVNARMVKSKDFEDYTLVMLQKWGIGKKEKNNGILIVISADLSQMRIQNGYGIEKILSDAETKYIVDHSFIPRFKERKYFQGTRDGIIALINKLQQKGM